MRSSPDTRVHRRWSAALAALILCLATASLALASEAPLDDAIQTSDAPLTLDEAVAIALRRNPDVRAAADRIGEAEAMVGQATAPSTRSSRLASAMPAPTIRRRPSP